MNLRNIKLSLMTKRKKKIRSLKEKDHVLMMKRVQNPMPSVPHHQMEMKSPKLAIPTQIPKPCSLFRANLVLLMMLCYWTAAMMKKLILLIKTR